MFYDLKEIRGLNKLFGICLLFPFEWYNPQNSTSSPYNLSWQVCTMFFPAIFSTMDSRQKLF